MPYSTTLKATLFVYDIPRCGLYLRNKNDPKHLPAVTLLKELKIWAIDSNKPLIETSTYSQGGRFEEAYCLGISAHNGQYLLALWNKVPHSKKGVGMVNGSQAASSAKISHAEMKDGDIPGYPTFYWFLPTSNKVIAVRLENANLGIGQLREYIKGYLSNFCSYRVKTNVDGEELDAFSDFPRPASGEDNRVANLKLFPSFSVSANPVLGKQEEILNRYDDITKLIKDVHIYNNLHDDNAGILEKISAVFNNLPAAKKKTARFQMPVSMSRQDTQELIDLFNNNEHSEEHDVGFVFKGSPHIEWLSGSQQKIEEVITVNWLNEGQPDLDKLLRTLQSFEHLLNPADTIENDPESQAG